MCWSWATCSSWLPLVGELGSVIPRHAFQSQLFCDYLKTARTKSCVWHFLGRVQGQVGSSFEQCSVLGGVLAYSRMLELDSLHGQFRSNLVYASDFSMCYVKSKKHILVVRDRYLGTVLCFVIKLTAAADVWSSLSLLSDWHQSSRLSPQCCQNTWYSPTRVHKSFKSSYWESKCFKSAANLICCF